jgi:hypothetical protein
VRKLRGQIAAMEKIVAGSGGSGGSNAQQAMQIDAVEGQIALLENQIRLLDEQTQKHTEQKAELDITIADTPRVEAALNAFQRRYDDLQTRYQVALRKQAEAATGEKLELDQKAERFEVIEQARVPTAPVAPKRMIIAASGAVGSLLFGLGIAFLLELLSSAIRTAADLERSMQLRPIVTVPYIQTRMEVRKRRLLQGLIVLVFVVVLPGSIWMVNQYVMPIEAISEWVLDKTGMEQFWQDVKPRLM